MTIQNLDRLTKCLEMLASDKPGEVLNAAKFITKIVKDNGGWSTILESQDTMLGLQRELHKFKNIALHNALEVSELRAKIHDMKDRNIIKRIFNYE